MLFVRAGVLVWVYLLAVLVVLVLVLEVSSWEAHAHHSHSHSLLFPASRIAPSISIYPSLQRMHTPAATPKLSENCSLEPRVEANMRDFYPLKKLPQTAAESHRESCQERQKTGGRHCDGRLLGKALAKIHAMKLEPASSWMSSVMSKCPLPPYRSRDQRHGWISLS